VVFLAGALYNIRVTLRSPGSELERLVDLSPVSFYRALAERVTLLHPRVFVLGTILFELAIASSVLLAPAWRRPAYVAALLFFLVLVPLIGWYGLTNVIWAVPAALLLRYDRPGSDSCGKTLQRP